MKHEEILEKATPRPWIPGKTGGYYVRFDSPEQCHIDRDLVVLAVNAYEPMMQALEWLDKRGGLGFEAHSMIRAALALARGEK